MSSTQYYYQPADLTLSGSEVQQRVGINPDTYGAEGLLTLGIYPVSATVQPYNMDLYTVVKGYNLVGGDAIETWTPTAKTLSDVQPLAIRQRGQTTAGRIQNLREESGFDGRVFIAVAALTNANRPAPFQDWMLRQQSTITELGTDITAINGAADVDAVNDVVSAAWGSIDIGYDPASPLDLLASDFTTDKFYSKNLSAADFELYFPQTTTTVAYSGGFAATASAFTSIDHTVQLRIAASGLVVDEFCVPASATVQEKEFGYRKYLDIGNES